MKIALLVHADHVPAPFNGTTMRDSFGLSGTETQAIYLAETFAIHGHEVYVINSKVIAGLNHGVIYRPSTDGWYDLVVDSNWCNFNRYQGKLKATHIHFVINCPLLDLPKRLYEANYWLNCKRITFSYQSTWCRDAFQAQHNLRCYPQYIIPAAIEPGSITPGTRRKNSFVFHSVWERGGEVHQKIYDRLNLTDKSNHIFGYTQGKESLGKRALFEKLATMDYALFPLVLPSGIVHKDTYNCALHEAMAAGVLCVAPRIRPLTSVYGEHVVWVDPPENHAACIHDNSVFCTDPTFLTDAYVESFLETVRYLDAHPNEREQHRVKATAWAQAENWEARYPLWEAIL